MHVVEKQRQGAPKADHRDGKRPTPLSLVVQAFPIRATNLEFLLTDTISNQACSYQERQVTGDLHAT